MKETMMGGDMETKKSKTKKNRTRVRQRKAR